MVTRKALKRGQISILMYVHWGMHWYMSTIGLLSGLSYHLCAFHTKTFGWEELGAIPAHISGVFETLSYLEIPELKWFHGASPQIRQWSMKLSHSMLRGWCREEGGTRRQSSFFFSFFFLLLFQRIHSVIRCLYWPSVQGPHLCKARRGLVGDMRPNGQTDNSGFMKRSPAIFYSWRVTVQETCLKLLFKLVIS